MNNKIQVNIETTPNPQSMKFSFTTQISDENAQFDNIGQCERSPLATKLFGFPWTQAVFIGTNFVTLTKQDWVEWETLTEPLAGLLQEHLENELPVLHPEKTTEEDENDSPTVKEIKKIINQEIRPAVAMDGGDIVFHKYEDNKVYLHMQGACAGCPSSTMTLKMGIEARLQEAVPEIEEVIAL